MTEEQQKIARMIAREEMCRVADRLDQLAEHLRQVNRDVAEKRRFKPGPFDLTADNERKLRAQILSEIAEALRK